jgi:hypothetical protein
MMRFRFLAIGALVLSCFIAGCDSGGGEAGVSDEALKNPNAGLDAMKKMGPMPTAKNGKIVPPKDVTPAKPE